MQQSDQAILDQSGAISADQSGVLLADQTEALLANQTVAYLDCSCFWVTRQISTSNNYRSLLKSLLA